ncbi:MULTISPECIES: hypothetical protein [Paenibacillaceae]|uniref:Uncharacterized protein n=3 Tax=Paenibacillus TaxID=44249 RepID=A0A7X2ZDC2_9BACL|nr:MULTISPECIES: hypothetical protein [Paenibacillaceae]EJL45749.1 hypothetical protein PMI08_01508 [Brevibacillus sp. CF112]MCM3472296.1 hypothetical protein [Brevibacillus borstelensis]MCM3561383.1 hypothetical protein [Brevibacillus borstelensis]MCM3592164.1 hypothetical protein [Brevibacillus borstelensis]MCM3625022.1 hypothetical protein [Brevibacillus borstelensis]
MSPPVRPVSLYSISAPFGFLSLAFWANRMQMAAFQKETEFITNHDMEVHSLAQSIE